MNRSRVRTAIIAFVIACISRVTGDMFLSRSAYGKAFGDALAGERPSSDFGSHFRPTLIRSKSIDRGRWADDGAPSGGARSFSPPADIASPATFQPPLSADQNIPAPVSLLGPLSVDSDLLNGVPGGDAGSTVGGESPGGMPPTGIPPGGGFPIVPPGGGGGPGGGPGGPPAPGVPEPSDWSMMVFGLLALGVPLRLSARSMRRAPQVALLDGLRPSSLPA
jgi:hypothetical protein